MTTYRTLKADGHEVFYREAGDPTQPTLLLLHGFPSTSAQYERLIEYLGDDYHLVAPDYPGFGRTAPLDDATTFDRIADIIEAFVEEKGLERYSLYMFDFGSPVGFRLATRHPERVECLIIQNATAYETGLGPKMRVMGPYWEDRDANEAAMRDFLTLETTRSQYVDGVPDPATVDPDLWELDQRYLDLPDRDKVMLDLLYDYQNNLPQYPAWQEFLRDNHPPTLMPWGQNDEFFPLDGARAFLADIPDAQLEPLDTGHIATATHSGEIARSIDRFLSSQPAG
ncbi:MAG TPA: alpha/beta hydrolase [Solirubrobacterales bacterium]|nr:alpha/beta hydrolase [Solirubrobacterales bacterium]